MGLALKPSLFAWASPFRRNYGLLTHVTSNGADTCGIQSDIKTFLNRAALWARAGRKP